MLLVEAINSHADRIASSQHLADHAFRDHGDIAAVWRPACSGQYGDAGGPKIPGADKTEISLMRRPYRQALKIHGRLQPFADHIRRPGLALKRQLADQPSSLDIAQVAYALEHLTIELQPLRIFILHTRRNDELER